MGGWVSVTLKGRALVARVEDAEGARGALPQAPACSGEEMLRQQRWAVVGRSSNNIVQRLLSHLASHGRDVHHIDPYGVDDAALNDAASGVKPTWRALSELPPDVAIDVVNLCANPKFGEPVIEECKVRGINNVFIQPGAESAGIANKCATHSMSLYHGCVLVELHDDARM
eukprot:NODE_3661_length_758_cov_256.547653.p1 GENE.NODE_3661_length_758_cov_256.547653~~NODE_3661_length_758_cov_256.547653.p1  ORF type:complete len:171 (-),score=44.34 NODE_3661_length_758_cov_256.547653:228-740(-)